MEEKIKEIQKRHAELEHELQDPATMGNPEKMKKISREYNELGQVLAYFQKLTEGKKELAETTKALGEEKDPELSNYMREEMDDLTKKNLVLEQKIKEIIEPKNPLDKKDIIVEIRAGAGGEEAALFAADLFRMYSRFAEKKRLADASDFFQPDRRRRPERSDF